MSRTLQWIALVGIACMSAAASPAAAHTPRAGPAQVDRATKPTSSFEAATQASSMRALPRGFRDRVVAHVKHPTAVAWTPDDRMLVTQKGGRLYVFGTNGRKTTALNLRRSMCINGSRGLMTVEVDPRFSQNHYIYLLWTHDAHHDCFGREGRAGLPEHRVVRYVLRDDNEVARGRAKVIVDHLVSAELQHQANDVLFGKDGYVYVSVGDGLCRVKRPRVCGPANNNAQRLDVPKGKVFRVTRTGTPPRTNPFAGKPGAHRCTKPGRIERGRGPCAEVFARGFRNPWRLARRPGTNTFYVNDVGLYDWEEIDRLTRRGNYGWNKREGHCATGSRSRCGPSRFDDPVFDYAHRGGCLSITGGVFVPPAVRGSWPRSYVGDYLFADFGCATIFRLTGKGNDRGRRPFVIRAGAPVDLAFGPYRQTQALYYLDYGSGTVHRVSR
jgi:glucose/arabinose dehydrogenase